MRITVRAFLLGMLTLLLPVESRAQEPDSSGLRDAAGGAGPPPLPDALYASRQTVASRARTRPRGRVVTVATTALVLHEVLREAGNVWVGSRYCAIRQDKLGNVGTELGRGFVEAIPEWEEVARIEGPGGGPWRVEVAERVVVLGAELVDPARDPLPSSAGDPRIRDPDGDGHPGVTVAVSGFVSGEVYLVQRLIRGLRGTLEPNGSMRGVVTGSSDQEVVGASNPMIKAFTPRFQQDPDPSTSLLEWVPVPRSTACEELVASEADLFGIP